MISINDYYNYIKTADVREPIYKIDLLNKEDDSILKTITNFVKNDSGSITISNADGSRRSASLTLRNYDNEWAGFFKYLTIGQRFKIYMGYRINGEDVLFAQGVFIFSDPNLKSQQSSKEIEINGADKWAGLDGTAGGILNSTYQINAGTSIGSCINDLLKLNIVNDFVTPNIDASIYNQQTTYDIIHEAGETVADVLLEVATNLSCYVYYDINGVFTMRPFDYDETLSPVYDYTYNDINYMGATKTLPIGNLYNSVLIVSDNTQNDYVPITASLDNNDPTDVNSVINGTVKKIYNVTDNIAGITTQQRAYDRARYELKKVACMQSTISLNSMPLYHLQENNVITVSDNYLSSNNERFLISGINFNIGMGDMTLDLVKTSRYL